MGTVAYRKNENTIGYTEYYKVKPQSVIVQKSFNPRENFDEVKLDELKESIIENGVLVPIRIKVNENKEFILIDGERRLRATLKAIEEGHQIESIPAIIERKTITEIDQLILALNTNTGEPLSPLEEGKAIKRLLNYGLTVADIARKLGKKYDLVKARLALTEASPVILKEVEAKNISLNDARRIVEKSYTIEDQLEKLEEVKENREEHKKEVAKKKAAKKAGKVVYDKKDFVELTADMIEWLVELNKSNPDGEIQQVNDIIERAQKMLDSEDC